MKILALGDVHLGAGAYYGRTPFGEGSRLEDQRRVLRRIYELACDEQVELTLFAGDAFHRRRPTPSEIVVWREFVEDMAGCGPVFAIDGNHDVEAADRPSALETVRQNVDYEVVRRPRLLSPSGLTDRVRPHTPVVATLPWTPPARLVASMNGQVARDEVNAVAADLLLDSARELRSQMPEEATKILLAHWSVSGSSLPNGLPVDQLREPVLPLAELEALGFDFFVFGHIHRMQTLSHDPLIVYTGSPSVVDFGEANTDHGVWIYDTEQPEQVRFEPIADRPFVTVDVDLTMGPGDSTLDETDVIAAQIAERFPLTDAVVRVRYRCTSEQTRRVDVAALRSLLHDAGVSKVYAIQADVVREDRARVEGVDEHLSEREALDLWIEAHPEIVGGKADSLRELVHGVREGAAA